MSENYQATSSPSSALTPPFEEKEATDCQPTRPSTGFSTDPSVEGNAFVKSGESSLSTGFSEIKTESPSEEKKPTMAALKPMDEGQRAKKMKLDPDVDVSSPAGKEEDEEAEEEEEEHVTRPNVVENAVEDKGHGRLPLCTGFINAPPSPTTVTLSSHSGPEAISALEKALAENPVWSIKVGDCLITAGTDYAKNLLLASMAKCLDD